MNPIDDRILKFIKRHHTATLATTDASGEAWCCNLFYAWLPEEGALVFTSSSETRHGRDMLAGHLAAASIVLETRVVAKVQGLQIQGFPSRAESGDALYKAAHTAYLKRFPYAVFAKGDLWILKLTRLKYTDNSLGFGTKLEWERGTE